MELFLEDSELSPTVAEPAHTNADDEIFGYVEHDEWDEYVAPERDDRDFYGKIGMGDVYPDIRCRNPRIMGSSHHSPLLSRIMGATSHPR